MVSIKPDLAVGTRDKLDLVSLKFCSSPADISRETSVSTTLGSSTDMTGWSFSRLPVPGNL